MTKLNERMEAGTDAAIVSVAQVTSSSQTIAKPNVLRRFRFEYRSYNKDLMIELVGSSLNDMMVRFATHYNFIDEVYKITEVL